jgi:hypothetical protein
VQKFGFYLNSINNRFHSQKPPRQVIFVRLIFGD